MAAVPPIELTVHVKIDELVVDLLATLEALTSQLAAINAHAEHMDVSPAELRDQMGGFTAAPVLVGIAAVQCTLAQLSMQEPTPQCGAARSGDLLRRYPCMLPPGHVAQLHVDEDGEPWSP